MQEFPSVVSSGKLRISNAIRSIGGLILTWWRPDCFAPGRRLGRWHWSQWLHHRTTAFFMPGHQNLCWTLALVRLTPKWPPVLLDCRKSKTCLCTDWGAKSRNSEYLFPGSGLRYKIPSITDNCSYNAQKVWMVVLSICTSFQGGFRPSSAQVSTFIMIRSSLCQVLRSSFVHGWHQSSQSVLGVFYPKHKRDALDSHVQLTVLYILVARNIDIHYTAVVTGHLHFCVVCPGNDEYQNHMYIGFGANAIPVLQGSWNWPTIARTHDPCESWNGVQRDNGENVWQT